MQSPDGTTILFSDDEWVYSSANIAQISCKGHDKAAA
jgi:hypothetical protein